MTDTGRAFSKAMLSSEQEDLGSRAGGGGISEGSDKGPHDPAEHRGPAHRRQGSSEETQDRK